MMELKDGRRGRDGFIFGWFAGADGGGCLAVAVVARSAFVANVLFVSSCRATAIKSASETLSNKSSELMLSRDAHSVTRRWWAADTKYRDATNVQLHKTELNCLPHC